MFNFDTYHTNVFQFDFSFRIFAFAFLLSWPTLIVIDAEQHTPRTRDVSHRIATPDVIGTRSQFNR